MKLSIVACVVFKQPIIVPIVKPDIVMFMMDCNSLLSSPYSLQHEFAVAIDYLMSLFSFIKSLMQTIPLIQ